MNLLKIAIFLLFLKSKTVSNNLRAPVSVISPDESTPRFLNSLGPKEGLGGYFGFP